jgi:hypothetical protein
MKNIHSQSSYSSHLEEMFTGRKIIKTSHLVKDAILAVKLSQSLQKLTISILNANDKVAT